MLFYGKAQLIITVLYVCIKIKWEMIHMQRIVSSSFYVKSNGPKWNGWFAIFCISLTTITSSSSCSTHLPSSRYERSVVGNLILFSSPIQCLMIFACSTHFVGFEIVLRPYYDRLRVQSLIDTLERTDVPTAYLLLKTKTLLNFHIWNRINPDPKTSMSSNLFRNFHQKVSEWCRKN